MASRRAWSSRTLAVGTAALLFSFTIEQAAQAEITAEQLDAAVAGIGVAQIEGSANTGKASVVLIPEIHGVILVQLEEALLLQRLSSGVGISSIVLEGLLPDAAAKISRPSDTHPSQGVALLREGTISAAEFMYLSKGINLIPGETHETHDPTATPIDVCGLIGTYAAKVLLGRKDALTSKAVSAYMTANANINNVIDQLNQYAKEQIISCESRNKQAEYNRMIVSSTKAVALQLPQMANFVRAFCIAKDTSDFIQIDEELQELTALRTMLSQELTANKVEEMDDYEAFVKARDQASLIMVKSLVSEAAKHPNGVAVAIVGAAHRNRMIEQLNDAGLRTAVISLESMKSPTKSALRRVSVARRLLLPLDTGPLGDVLVSAFSPNRAKVWADLKRISSCKDSDNRKEETVLTTPWFTAKAEFHSAVDAVAKAALAGGDMNGPPKEPPGTYDLAGMLPPDDGRWNKTHVHINVAGGLIVYRKLGGPRIVVPVTITDDHDQQVGATIWAMISLAGNGSVKNDVKDSEIESMLNDAIADEKSDEKPENKGNGEDAGVPIRISMSTEAKLFRNKQAALDSAGNSR